MYYPKLNFLLKLFKKGVRPFQTNKLCHFKTTPWLLSCFPSHEYQIIIIVPSTFGFFTQFFMIHLCKSFVAPKCPEDQRIYAGSTVRSYRHPPAKNTRKTPLRIPNVSSRRDIGPWLLSQRRCWDHWRKVVIANQPLVSLNSRPAKKKTYWTGRGVH